MDREILICKGGYTFESLVELVKQNKSKLIFFWIPEEAMLNPFADYLYNGKTYQFLELDIILNEYDVEMITMFSSPPDYVVFEKILTDQPIKNFKFIFWPTYLLHFSYYNMISVYGDDYVINKDFNKLYFNFNNQPHSHRQLVMDYICRYQLFDHGINTWNRIPHSSDMVDLKCWEMKIQKLDDMIEKENHEITGGGYNARYYFTRDILETKCLINLVTETFCGENKDALIYHTEKTFKNYLIEQPFIVVGSPNQNTNITKYGFKLYDEIFDYSFDEQYSKINRIKDVLVNLLILKDKDYKKLYELVDEKIKYNKKRALEIINNDPYIPEEFIKIYKQYKEIFDKMGDKGDVVSKYLCTIMLNK
jgi:hypothetical protein